MWAQSVTHRRVQYACMAAPTFYSNPAGHPSPAYNAPLSNGGPLYELSRADMAAAGSTPLGAGMIKRAPPAQVPQTQGSQAAMMPNTAAAAAAMQQQQAAMIAQQQQLAAQKQQAMIAQQAQIRAQAAAAAMPALAPVASLYPQVTAKPAAPQAAASSVPASVAAACDYAGPVAGAGLDCSDFTKAVGGDLKSRVLTAYALITPAHHHTSTVSVDLAGELADILKYKHAGSPDKRDGALERTVIMGVRLIAAKNKLPTAVVVRMTGCKGRDYDCRTNARGLLVMPPGYKEDCGANPRALHLYAPSVSMHAFSRFGKIRVADLSKDVTPVPGKAWSLVNVNSPIVEVIKASQAELKSTLQDVKIIEGMMPVKNELVDSVQQFLQENIAKFPGTDCSKFSVDFVRSAGCHFAEKGDIAAPEEQAQFHLREGKPVYVKVIVDYVIISNTKVGSDMARC